MIRNVVLAKLKTGYDATEVEQIQQGLRDLDCPEPSTTPWVATSA